MIDMLRYHLFLAWKSIRRTPKHSAIVIAGIALGVTVATLFSAIYYSYARDPIPEKSSVLYYVRMDNWDPARPHPDGGPAGIPPLMSYLDMREIIKSKIPVRQTAAYRSALHISPATEKAHGRLDWARICHADFFAMFGLPFRYGSGWTREADEKAEPVVVIDDLLNQRFFKGENSVGRAVRIEGRDFRVIGVLAPFRPSIRYYDVSSNGSATVPPERIFLSMGHMIPMEIGIAGAAAMYWGQSQKKPGFVGHLESEWNFLQMWVELPRADEVAAYKSFLDAYALEQRSMGRFQRPLNNRVTPMLDYLREQNVPPPEVTAMAITANLFLVACALSLMGLLLSRFLARADEMSVRRALGARRWDVFMQHVVECEFVALVGGLLGLGVASASLWLVNGWYKTHMWGNRDDVLRMDATMAWFALGASLLAGLIAGVYPALRVCRLTPASQLKIQ